MSCNFNCSKLLKHFRWSSAAFVSNKATTRGAAADHRAQTGAELTKLEVFTCSARPRFTVWSSPQRSEVGGHSCCGDKWVEKTADVEEEELKHFVKTVTCSEKLSTV